MHKLNQNQNESYLALAILLYQSDHKIKEAELNVFDVMTSEINWRGDLSISNFRATILKEVREALDTDIEPFVAKYAQNLQSEGLIARLIELCGADGTVCHAEHTALELISKHSKSYA